MPATPDPGRSNWRAPGQAGLGHTEHAVIVSAHYRTRQYRLPGVQEYVVSVLPIADINDYTWLGLVGWRCGASAPAGRSVNAHLGAAISKDRYRFGLASRLQWCAA